MANKIHTWETGDEIIKQYWFYCPGCKNNHAFTVGPQREGWGTARWTFNGSFDRPTFSPSLLCNKDHPASRCHSFVEDGKIRFLEDCWHELKGQTVDLTDWDQT
jgi:hypothetical protein